MTALRDILRRATVGTQVITPREPFDRAMARVSSAPLRTGNNIQLLRNGPETFEDWLRAIRSAERWVHLEHYLFRADNIGQQFAEALAERAAAGVPVRVLVDWFGSLDVSWSFWRQLRRAGVDVRVVNPPTIGAPLDVLKRDHRKLLAVDGTYASAGGVCISDVWLEHSPQTGLPYRDTAISVQGPAVADLEQAFAVVWEQAGASLPPEEKPRVQDLPAVGDKAVRVIIQEPSKMRVMRVLQLLTAGVEQRLWIADAYFLSMPMLTQALMSTAQDDVDVRLLVPATSDVPLVGPLSRTGYRQLLRSGVRIFEYGGLMMHAKTTVADGWWTRIGSTNLNITGLLMNWEIDIIVEDRQVGAEMEATFEEDFANAREVRLVPTAHRTKLETERPIPKAERRVQHKSFQGRSRVMTTMSQVGQAVFQQSTDTLHQHERAVGAAVSGVLLGASILTARFPRLLAWPLAAFGGLLGTLGLLRAARPNELDQPLPLVQYDSGAFQDE
jgi:cardiolipin synthase